MNKLARYWATMYFQERIDEYSDEGAMIHALSEAGFDTTPFHRGKEKLNSFDSRHLNLLTDEQFWVFMTDYVQSVGYHSGEERFGPYVPPEKNEAL